MGVRTLIGEADGQKAAGMYDSVSGWMFGPIFEGPESAEQIQAFLEWLTQDARAYSHSDLEEQHSLFRFHCVDPDTGLLKADKP